MPVPLLLEGVQNGLRARRIDLVDRAEVGGSAIFRRSVNIAGRIERYAGDRTGAIRAVLERMQHGFLAAGVQLVHNPIVPIASADRGSIQIAVRIHGEAGLGMAAIRAAGETVEHAIVLRAIEFEDHARVTGSTDRRCPIKVAGGIQDERGNRLRAIRASGEIV